MAGILTSEERAERAAARQYLERPWRNLDFCVYRFVPPTDKRGLPYPELTIDGRPQGLSADKVWVGDFAPRWGEFLLDLGEPVYDIQNHQPLVTRLEGYGLDQGRVKYRNLQQLPFPWGIDGSLPVQIWANEQFRDNHRLPFNPRGMSRLDLQWEARRRGLPTKGKRSEIIQRINRLELKKGAQAPDFYQREAQQRIDSVQLPLFRVLEPQEPVKYTPQTPLKQPPFDTGEIVLVYGHFKDDETMCLVRDYEGNRGRISTDFLEEIEAPFGLKLNRRELVELLERLGWADEVDKTPEPEEGTDEWKAIAAKRLAEAAKAGATEMWHIYDARWKEGQKRKKRAEDAKKAERNAKKAKLAEAAKAAKAAGAK
ncbi:uncharacterized protein EAF01_007673 [Botrytis porri]|uniref:uncharacterized protein n=1 Tax=Botrytis porri TaxID=87229 RepID=UPI0018FF5B2D|nr:uncharacterized protein EAF01_007673 [Botrytis porri]KAF7900371.1 hypothetical protein EAF01_007673 [Botrytis porri]